MTLTPKARANIAAGIVSLPYCVLVIFHRELVSERTLVYLVFASVLLSALAYQWVYHRHVSRLPAPALPKAELSLVSESLPKAAWLGAVPPVLVAVMLWWLTVHGSDLPWRDTWLAPPTPAVTHRFYRTMVLSIVVWNSLALWSFVVALAIWHGMSRAYAFRRSALLIAVANQWALFIGITAHMCSMSFRLPVAAAVVSGIAYAASLCIVFWNGWHLRDLYAASPRTGTWFFVDSADPTLAGPRGVNLANGWCWIVAAAVVAPLILVQWFLYRTQA